MRFRPTALTASAFLLLSGCSGGKEGDVPPNASKLAVVSESASSLVSEPAKPVFVRKEFVVVREIVRQHKLQQGKEQRMEAIEKALRERFPALPDKGQTEEERSIFEQAEALLSKIETKSKMVNLPE